MGIYTIPAMSTDVGREALISKIATLLKDYMKDGRTRTDLLKEAAPLILALRESHTLSDGRADTQPRGQRGPRWSPSPPYLRRSSRASTPGRAGEGRASSTFTRPLKVSRGPITHPR